MSRINDEVRRYDRVVPIDHKLVIIQRLPDLADDLTGGTSAAGSTPLVRTRALVNGTHGIVTRRRRSQVVHVRIRLECFSHSYKIQ